MDRLAGLSISPVKKVEDEPATAEKHYVMPGTDPLTGKALPFYKRHAGRFRLVVQRPMKTKLGFFRVEWLPGLVEGEEVEVEAMSLMDDEQDNIVHVSVYSVKDEMFVMSYERRRT